MQNTQEETIFLSKKVFKSDLKQPHELQVGKQQSSISVQKKEILRQQLQLQQQDQQEEELTDYSFQDQRQDQVDNKSESIQGNTLQNNNNLSVQDCQQSSQAQIHQDEDNNLSFHPNDPNTARQLTTGNLNSEFLYSDESKQQLYHEFSIQITHLQQRLQILDEQHSQTNLKLKQEQELNHLLESKLELKDQVFSEAVSEQLQKMQEQQVDNEEAMLSIKLMLAKISQSYQQIERKYEMQAIQTQVQKSQKADLMEELKELRHQLQQAESQITQKESIIKYLNQAIRKWQDQYNKSNKENNQQIANQKLCIEQMNQQLRTLQSQQSEFMQENQKITDQNLLVIEENLKLKEQIKFLQEQCTIPSNTQRSSYQLFSTKHRDHTDHSFDQSFHSQAATAIGSQPISSCSYNPIPQRSFNKFDQPSLQLTKHPKPDHFCNSTGLQQDGSIPTHFYPSSSMPQGFSVGSKQKANLYLKSQQQSCLNDPQIIHVSQKYQRDYTKSGQDYGFSKNQSVMLSKIKFKQSHTWSQE